MKKKLTTTFIISMAMSIPAFADFAFTEQSDFTGEAFFTPYVAEPQPKAKKHSEANSGTIPPVKLIRMSIQEKLKNRDAKRYEFAPTAQDIYEGELETSDYASKEVEDDFEEMSPDGFETVEESSTENIEKPKRKLFRKKLKNKNEDNDIILDCDNVDYDTQNYLIKATGGVSVEFVKQGTTVKAETITFDRLNNTVMAEGDVKILKSGQVITGDYIFVDMNEENALIENPKTTSGNIEIKSRKGYVYTDKVVQEDGSLVITDSFPINFHSANRGPQMRRMLVPKNETLTDDMSKGIIKLQAKDIKIKQKGDIETISFTRMRLFKGDKVFFRTPAIKVYTNKNHDYAETNHWEIGAYRGFGVFAGPGVVFELPKGSVLKAMPILNYKSGFGYGGYGRFSSGTNQTMLGYGTATEKMIVLGKQKLDDDLYIQYGMNSYMDEWFLGRRRPKYGAALVYKKGYGSNNFLIKGQRAMYTHRLDAGYYQDLDFDTHFEKIKGTDMGTSRFRYMAEGLQNIYSYKNEEEQKALELAAVAQFSGAVYGNGNTQVIGRIGPRLHTQYKRWMQDIGYFYSKFDDNTPMPVFDMYRYGKQNVYLREYFRINRYLTLSWFGSINLSGDSPNGKDFQENSFYVSVGPDDMKFNVGYDFVRENLYCTVELMMDAKGTKVEYDSLEIKQDKKAKNDSKPKSDNSFESAPVTQTVLQRAVVEDIKVHEDVL
ncbi:MAG: hypothetical protein E7Z92_06455 [Cyanobacteria bacterium SIG31]|nr:hypothetical protein [Cyanobacteria bacterium SIG31]